MGKCRERGDTEEGGKEGKGITGDRECGKGRQSTGRWEYEIGKGDG
jgi:hypothetical protein